jgi:hypothetical protein
MNVARDALRVLLAGAVLAALAAGLVTLSGAGDTLRAWYGLTPDRPLQIPAPALWVHNVRAGLLVFAAAAAVAWWPRLRSTLDILLAVVVGANVLLVGAALGAYGRALWQLGPGHYPLELFAVAIALAAYLDARRCTRLRPRVLLTTIGASWLALAAAALLESAGAR